MSRIAVIGRAGRFPGAPDLSQLWRNLVEGRETVTFFTPQELAQSGVPSSVLEDPAYVRAASLLSGVELFDADFFGLGRSQAERTDPQHRLFLEAAWSALEDAAYPPNRCPVPVGVFAASSLSSYLLSNLAPGLEGLGTVEGLQTLFGNDKDYLATRVSYELDLRGPSLAVQTACSSSLVAVALACQSLLDYQCDMALAGGVSVRVPQRAGYLYQEGGILSPDGHCRPFAAAAAGTLFGSGLGLVVLKRLEDALEDGDPIRAVIRGWAINNDGADKVGYSAPSIGGQSEVIALAQDLAEVEARSITLVECHGTGTQLGDPIEIAALTDVFREDTDEHGFCAVGSVKSNFGHLEAAAGIASLLKAVLALEHGIVPPSLHFNAPNPAIDFASSPFRVATTARPWSSEGPRRAGVSSFGIGGTNAHLVLEEAPPAKAVPAATARPHLLRLSARGETPLGELAKRFRDHLLEHPGSRPADLARTAAVGRANFPQRLAVVAESGSEMAEKLAAIATGETPPHSARGRAAVEKATPVAFLFTGQGAQYSGMGRELYESEPVFRQTLERCAAILDGKIDLLEVLYGGESTADDKRLDETLYTQPALYSLQSALAALWRSWGVEPAFVLGHSVGEYAAAAVAGAFSLEDGLRLVAERARFMQGLERGAMSAVFAAEEKVRELLAPHAGAVAVAAVNGPRETVISGRLEVVAAVEDACRAARLKCRRLPVSHAFHSPLVEPMLDDLETAATRFCAAPAAPAADEGATLVTNLYGRKATAAELDATYWRRQARQPVRFADAVEQLYGEGARLVVEIGPRPTLSALARRVLDQRGSEMRWLPSLRQGHDERRTMLAALAGLYAGGAVVDWPAVAPAEGRRVSLPTYPFERRRYWIEPPSGAGQGFGDRAGAVEAAAATLLGRRREGPLPSFENRLDAAHPLLAGHRVAGQVTVPAAFWLEAAREAVISFGENGAGSVGFAETVFLAPLALTAEETTTVHLVFPEGLDGTWRIYARGRDGWRLLVRGTVGSTGPAPAPVDPASRISETARREDGDEHYARIGAHGIEMGADYRRLAELWRGAGTAVGRLSPRREGEGADPALLDACLQTGAAAATGDTPSGEEDKAAGFTALPMSLERLELWGDLATARWCVARRLANGDGEGVWACELHVLAEDGVVLARIARLVFRRLDLAELTAAESGASASWQRLVHRVHWRVLEEEALPASREHGSWLVVARPGDPLAPGLAERLAALGAQPRCVEVSPGRQIGGGLLGKEPCFGVVDLTAASCVEDAAAEDEAPAELLARALGLLQETSRSSHEARLWLVTRGAQAVTGDDTVPHPTRALLWGLGRVAAREQDETWGGLIDLPAAGEGNDLEHEADPLARLLLAERRREDQLALRGGRFFVPRLQAAPISGAALEPRADAAYLITGGLGALGRHVARGLVERGARHLVLVGRTPAGEEAAPFLAELEAAGARIETAALDVAERSALADLLARLDAAQIPLAGIIHAAGVVDDGLIASQSASRAAAVLTPKVAGAWNLHRLCAERELDFFVLFSSAAAFLGPPGQASYAAANAFLGALAEHRRSRGLPALALEWGPWNAGMAAASGAAERWAESGLDVLEPSLAISAFTALAGASPSAVPPRLAVLAARWPRFAKSLGETPLFAELAGSPAAPRIPRGRLAEELADALAADPEAGRGLLVERLLALAGAILGGELENPLEPESRFFDHGMDSLMALELRGRLEKELGLDLPSTLIFDHPTVADLADHLAPRLERVGEPAPARAAAPVARLDKEADGEEEVIAVVGMGCRFPGGAHDPETFWQLLRRGFDAVVEVPPERWDVDAYYDPDPDAPGKMSTRWGGFLRGVDPAGFDARFFSIAPREAVGMDPQQRLLLEVAWEALEDAGMIPERLGGRPGGVFVGVMLSDWATLQRGFDAHQALGNDMSFAAGRLSHVLGLQGPSMMLNTACSSSLVAVHLACESLRRGECELALAGGVNLMLAPEPTIGASKIHSQAPDGRCKTFDDRADGYVRGEGCGMVVLKRLAEARANGDRVLALVRGSAVNHNGLSAGISVPHGPAQKTVIRRALAAAKAAPSEIGYVEAHGTGTALGDPIELRALAEVFGGREKPLRVGSVKTNFGHLEPAAGIAGLIKTIQIVRHGEIPPHLHFERPTPHFEWSGAALEVPRETLTWEPGSGQPGAGDSEPRLAGVSSFGLSGVNAHVVVESPAPLPAPVPGVLSEVGPWLLPLSAGGGAHRAGDALREAARSYAGFLDASTTTLGEICSTAARRRAHRAHRLAVAAESREQLRRRLAAFAAGETVRGVARASLARARRGGDGAPRTVFVFAGMGAQWSGMGRRLRAESAVFNDAVKRCAACLEPWLERPLEELWELPDLEAAPVGVIQPLLFATAVGIVEMLREWGLEPDAVLGHSLGEAAAAWAAGILDLGEAARVVGERSRYLAKISGRGAMALIGLERRAALIAVENAGLGEELEIAAINGPESTVVVGEPAAVEKMVAHAGEEGIFARRVRIDVATHSTQVEPFLEDLKAALEGLEPRSAEAAFFSTVDGGELEARELGPTYWGRNLRQPVLFAAAVEAAQAAGYEIFVEISPHPVLLPALRRVLAARSTATEERAAPVALATLRRDDDSPTALLAAVGELHCRGRSPDWRRLYGTAPPVSLPAYPWQRQRYWPELTEAPTSMAAPVTASPRPAVSSARHPLLGEDLRPSLPGADHLWQAQVDAEAHPWLAGHRVAGIPALPGAACLEMALTAAAAAWESSTVVVEEVDFSRLLELGAPRLVQLRFAAVDGDATAGRFELRSRPTGGSAPYIRHAGGTVRVADPRPSGDAPPALDLEALQDRLPRRLSGEEHYHAFAARGLRYEGVFRAVEEAWCTAGEGETGEALAELAAAPESGGFTLHPALLDAAFQVVAAALPGVATAALEGGGLLPAGVERFRLHGKAAGRLYVHARTAAGAAGEWRGDLLLLTGDGTAVAEIEGLRLAPFAAPLADEELSGVELFGVDWRLAEPATPLGEAAAPWLVLAAERSDGETLATAGRRRGVEVRLAQLDAAAWRQELEDSPELAGVAYLAPVGGADEPVDPAALLEVAQALAARGDAGRGRPAVLRVLTRGAAGPRPAAPWSAALWGFTRSLGHEHPELAATLVDLGAGESAETWERAWEELLAAGDETQVAHHASGRRVARLARRAAPSPARFDADPGVTWWITGGLGALGLLVARRLARCGARHFALTGRGEPGTAARKAIAELESGGARVEILPADVAVADSLAAALAEIDAKLPPLGGVIHAAGVLDDALIADLDRQRLAAVLAPKVDGALLLDRLTRDRSLEHFVLFSSATGVLGAPGQANYAAANAFLDAFAAWRRAQGRPALSIAWGAWAGDGMAAREKAELERRGIGRLDPERALDLLERLLARRGDAPGDATSEPLVAVAHLDVGRLPPQPFFEALGAERDRTAAAELRAAPAEERLARLGELLRGWAAEALRLPRHEIDPLEPLLELGIDSLMAMELRARIETELGHTLPVADFLEGANVDALARRLLEHFTTEELLRAVEKDHEDDKSDGESEEDWEVVNL